MAYRVAMRTLQHVPAPVTVASPDPEGALPIVLDSPHSGRYYPPDFRPALAHEVLRSGEDLYIDQLYERAPSAGATLVCAQFPRAYIDPNRTLADLDAAMLDGPWPEPLKPGPKTALGIGLIWKLAQDQPVYDRLLGVDEVRARIDTWYRPYHGALQSALDDAYARHACYWHLNIHSMPDDSYARLKLPVKPLADFVLGDLDGSTFSEPALQVIEQALQAHGYSTARNDPFKGVDIIRQHGQPQQRRYSLQVEIKRSCYADVAAHARGPGFDRARAAVEAMVQALAAHVRGQI